MPRRDAMNAGMRARIRTAETLNRLRNLSPEPPRNATRTPRAPRASSAQELIAGLWDRVVMSPARHRVPIVANPCQLRRRRCLDRPPDHSMIPFPCDWKGPSPKSPFVPSEPRPPRRGDLRARPIPWIRDLGSTDVLRQYPYEPSDQVVMRRCNVSCKATSQDRI
jgi:hypothetical protein